MHYWSRLYSYLLFHKPVEDQDSFEILIERVLERARLINENRRYREHLEEQVGERTFELETANRVLQEEITERKRMEEKLAAREQEFRTLAENSPDSILRYDSACRCVYANPRIEKILGIPAGGMPGKTPMELFPVGEYREYQDRIEEVLKTGGDAELEVVVPDMGEGVQYHHIRFAAEFSEQGNVTGVLAIGREITERIESEERLREKQERLNAMALELSLTEERERRAIATELHDQIGQDLTLAKIKLGVLAKAIVMENAAPVLNGIREILDGVIRHVRALTHRISPPILESGSLELALKWLARQMEEDYGLQVRFICDTSDKPLTDETRSVLYHAVRELLINVAKHANAITVTVTAARKDDSFLLVVADDGIGFDSADIIENGGIESGFGLFNVRRRIVHLGGTFEAESSPGKGATVTIVMPLDEE